MASNKNNSGVLFKSDRKKTERHPDYTGSAVVDGEDYRISAWVKDGKKGKFLSIAFTAKEEQTSNDDLPF